MKKFTKAECERLGKDPALKGLQRFLERLVANVRKNGPAAPISRREKRCVKIARDFWEAPAKAKAASEAKAKAESEAKAKA